MIEIRISNMWSFPQLYWIGYCSNIAYKLYNLFLCCYNKKTISKVFPSYFHRVVIFEISEDFPSNALDPSLLFGGIAISKIIYTYVVTDKGMHNKQYLLICILYPVGCKHARDLGFLLRIQFTIFGQWLHRLTDGIVS